MTWDLEDIALWAVGLLVLCLYLWAKYRSGRSLGWSDAKAKAFSALCLSAGLSFLGAFEVAASLAAPAEIEGAIARTYLHASGKYDHSNFDVRSFDGHLVNIASAHNFVQLLETGETVDVLYNRWTSFPYKVERLDGTQRQLLLKNDRHDALNWVIFLGAAVGGAYYARKFRSADAES
jgi:hypothetical protein